MEVTKETKPFYLEINAPTWRINFHDCNSAFFI